MSKRENGMVPQIRFKGLDGAWEERRLGIVCTIGDADHWMPETTSHGIPYIMTGDFFGINEIDFQNAKLISLEDYEKLARKIKPEVGDILFARYASIGSVRYIRTDRNFIASYSCAIMKSNKSFNSEYLFFLLQSQKTQNQLKESTNTGSPGNIGIDSLKQLAVFFPRKTEQTQISSYFRELDQLIQHHQHKHDKLLTLKLAMLQKMFPQPGATTPEIRFKGFEGEWVEKPFNLITTRSTQMSDEQDLPRLEYEDIISGAGLLNKDIYKKASDKKGFKFGISDVLFGKLRPYLRNWYFASFNGIAVGDFWVLRESGVASLFLYVLIQTSKFETIANQSAGSKMPRSDWNLVSNSCYFVPSSFTEQQKIGTYFRQLDELISRHATQLEKLKQVKAACLEKMFV